MATTPTTMHWFGMLLALGACIGCISPAYAEVTVGLYEREKASAHLHFYLVGLGHAYGYTNALLEARGQPKFYCQPPKLSLIDENFRKIYEDELSANRKDDTQTKYKDDTAIGIVLLRGLMKTFPCK